MMPTAFVSFRQQHTKGRKKGIGMMPGDRLTSPEAARESADRDGSGSMSEWVTSRSGCSLARQSLSNNRRERWSVVNVRGAVSAGQNLSFDHLCLS